MKILIIGDEENFEEAKLKFGEAHDCVYAPAPDQLDNVDIVFDFTIEEAVENIEIYNSLSVPVFLNAVKVSLAEFQFLYGLSPNIFGFNGLKTFVNRPQLEISALVHTEGIKEICKSLGTEYQLVNDRVGMVAPRVIFMIINEAYYTVQEGTADKEAIDQGMKLGTNYPYGPFEWIEKVGVKDVYETLEALYEDTKEERYKICPLLKKEYLLN